MTKRVNYRPLLSDELTLAGETFEHTVSFAAVADSGAQVTTTKDVCVYVPASVRSLDNKQVGAEHKVLVFWTANNAVSDRVLNDTLTHGLRASAESGGFVLISLPSPGDHPKVPLTGPDFHVFSDKDITDCFKGAGLKGKPGTIRLAAHSRGHRGLTKTLMGNNSIGDTRPKERDPNTATIKTSFIDVASVDRIIYLDNFFASAQRILGKLVSGGSLANDALRVFHFTDGINITDRSIVKDMAAQFFDLGKLLTFSEGAAIGSLRYIGEATAITATLNNKDLTLANKLLKDADLLRVLFLKRLPLRGTFSSLKPLAANMMDIGAWNKSASFTDGEKKKLLEFLNTEQLLRTSFKFGEKIGAHHFFVCEFAHEFYA